MKKYSLCPLTLLLIVFSFLAACRKTVIETIVVQDYKSPVVIARNSNLQDGNVLTPGSSNQVGAFVLQNNSTTDTATVNFVLVEVKTDPGNTFSNMSVYSTRANSYIADPAKVNAFTLGTKLPPGGSDHFEINLTTNVADTGTLQILLGAIVVWKDHKDTIFGVQGQTSVFKLPVLDSVYCTNYPRSSFIASANGAVDATTFGYILRTSGGGRGIIVSDLTFAVVGPQTATSLRIQNMQVAFVNGVAHFSGMQMWGGYFGITPSYPAVGSVVPSNTKSQIILTEMVYSDGLHTHTVHPNVASPEMTLVGSQPIISVFKPNGSVLASGWVEAIDVSIKADEQGFIDINSLPAVQTYAYSGQVSFTPGAKFMVKDNNDSLVSTQSGLIDASGVGKIPLTNKYRIAAGKTAFFKIFVPVSYVLPNSSLTTSILATDDFRWTDGAGGAITPYVGTSLIDNYPSYYRSVINTP